MEEYNEKEEVKQLLIRTVVITLIATCLIVLIAVGLRRNRADDPTNETASVATSVGATDAASENTSKADAGASKTNDASGAKSESAHAASSAEDLTPSDATTDEDEELQYFVVVEPPKLPATLSGVAFDTEKQMSELADYWSKRQMDAVRDLVRLERYEAMSYSVEGGRFLYTGDTDANGAPNGTGLAVYGDNSYYYGGWKNGKRSGKGEWIQFYPESASSVVTEHFYNGDFRNDLPYGEGHEHYDYDESRMEDFPAIYVQNAIGSFKNGYYDGEIYLITLNADGGSTEWYGTFSMGVCKKMSDTTDVLGQYPMLYSAQDPSHYIWLTEERNKDLKIANLNS